LFCDQPFGPLIIPAALRRKTILAVGGTQMTLRGAAIGGRFPREGQVPTSKRLDKPELSTTHVVLLVGGGRRCANRQLFFGFNLRLVFLSANRVEQRMS